jgi:hypothetical protein
MRASHAAAIPFLLASFVAAGCGRERPGGPDGAGTIVVAVTDTSGFFPGSVLGEPFFMDSTDVSIQSRTHIFTASRRTGESGVAVFEGLASGIYSVFVRREVSVGPNKVVFTGFGDLQLAGEETATDTILAKTVSVSNLMINEIFYAGSCASSYYFYDQYVELYNASNDTLYLDNVILTRQLGTIDPDMENKDYVRAIYAFQLKGTGRQWPIAPGRYVVIAADAVNHRNYCANSPDLSKADYECFNALGNDYDVPGVPNFESIIPGRTTDYLINLVHNAVVIATGEEYSIDENNYMFLPIYTVIDGVEYSANPSAKKEMTVRVDAGFAGVGVTRYSATSVERREPGLDTNNSTYDFVNISPVTPGYFHGMPAWMRWR